MDKYKLIITDHALYSMAEIRDYIAFELFNTTAALEHLRLFRKEIRTLSENPERYRVIDEEPWKHEKIRRMKVKNYYVYYWVYEDVHTVYVTDVIYAGSDQMKWLEQMPLK